MYFLNLVEQWFNDAWTPIQAALSGYGGMLLSGLGTTLVIALVSLACGLVLGLLGASAKLSRYCLLRFIATAYTTLIRGMPELVMVLLLSSIANTLFFKTIRSLVGRDDAAFYTSFCACVMALALAFGAYSTEVFRAAVQAIPKGQWEAAQVMGMGRFKIFMRIILPQVWRLALPGLGNLFQVLLKDTALVSVVSGGLVDIMRAAQNANNATHQPFTFYLAAAILYLLMTVFSTAITNVLERLSKPELRRRKA